MRHVISGWLTNPFAFFSKGTNSSRTCRSDTGASGLRSADGGGNTDPRAKGWIKVVFLPNYRVTLAERIIPAADLSEQISTAGHEASGTSTRMFAMNGAPTTGTLDGANNEIKEWAANEAVAVSGARKSGR